MVNITGSIARAFFTITFKLAMSMCLLTGFASAYGQGDSTRNFIGAGYFSEGGLYPGFTIFYERSLLASQNFEMVATARAGSYFHYRNQTGVFLMAQSGQRFRLYRNLYYEHYLGIGYLHTFLNGGDAYYVDATGQVHKASNWGNAHVMPSVSFGLSYVIRSVKNPIRIFGRPVIFWQIPFNKSELVQYGLEVGVVFKYKR